MSAMPVFDLVVCMRVIDAPKYFPDDEYGVCCRCNARIRFRPYVPKGPPKACLQCAMILVSEASYD